MTPQELKTSILWYAIQGKISKQEESESAQDILRGLSLSAITEDESYFDIPSNWKWCKIKDIFTLVNGKAFKPTDWGQVGLPIVRIQNLNDSNAPFNYFSGDIEEKYILHGGELLFSWSGTPGTSFGSFIWNGGKAVLNQHIFIVYPRFQLDTKYAMYALNGELKIFIEKAHGGAGLKHITKKEFENCVLPIPPYAEQKRIVAKLEEILPLIDRYEVAWNKLEEFNKRFPGDMQKSILQLAIQGKLVEQRPEEGTGEGLFQQIQKEKQALIKAGKIKKEKPLPEITEDEISFDIPGSWKWVRFGELVNECFQGINTAADHVVFEREHGIPIIQTGDITSGKLNIIGTKLMSEVDYSKYCEKYQPRYNDIFYCNIGTIGKPYIFTENYQMLFHWNLFIIRYNHALILPMYLKTYLDYCTDYFKRNTDGTAMQFVSKKKLVNVLVPLPPLEEQKRIVAKLEEILPLCDRLK